jgi:hypothetical protein
MTRQEMSKAREEEGGTRRHGMGGGRKKGGLVVGVMVVLVIELLVTSLWRRQQRTQRNSYVHVYKSGVFRKRAGVLACVRGVVWCVWLST